MSNKILCIYHGNCADGFASAWCVRRALGAVSVEFYAGVYQNDPPDAAGRDVLMVDFSYKKEVLRAMAYGRPGANTILVLDHHKTAAEELKWITKSPPNWDEWEGAGPHFLDGECAVAAVFDMERSGAGITWDFFFPATPRPQLINHIEDRDLWRFSLDGTREIQAAVFSYPYDFEVWDWLMLEADLEQLRIEGQAIERKHHKDIAELTGVVTRMFTIGGHYVPVANLPYTLTSDAGHLLCGETFPFAGCYWDTPDGRVFSLRSRDDGADVGEVAKQYGGGGHKHASGFRVSFDHELAG